MMDWGNQARWYAKNRERERERRRIYRLEHSEEFAERLRVWRRLNPEKHASQQARRRARKAGVARITVLTGPDCFVCGFPLDGDVSIGHEPPLAYCAANGIASCVERPEHLSCNLQKGAKIDSEMSFSWP